MMKLVSLKERELDIGHALYGEVGLYILEGAIANDGHRYEPKQLLVAKNPGLCRFTMEAGTTVFLFGGEPMAEPRIIRAGRNGVRAASRSTSEQERMRPWPWQKLETPKPRSNGQLLPDAEHHAHIV
jgi:hypothetical protein